MKKLFKYASMAIFALAFAACSNSDEFVEPGQKVVWDKDGNGYIAFNVCMPTDKGTRANDNFDKGSAWEYGVKDVALVLFKGANEADATYQEFVNISDVDFGDAANGNITLDKKYVAKISGMEINAGEKVYALAVINRNKVFTYESGALKIGGNEITSSTKFSDIQGFIMNTNLNANGTGTGANAALQSTTGGILMLNAPLCNVQGSTTTTIASTRQLNILQDVTSSIFATENEAREGACANIYVERAVAKVTVTHDSKSGSTSAFDWDLQAWRLDNTNMTSYVVRNMSNFDATYLLHSYMPNGVYRMVGAASVLHDAAVSAGDKDTKDRYRTYFAIDPNYNTAATAFNAGNNSMSFGSNNPEYCAENVFDVEHQVWGQTTRVIVKANLTPKSGDSFYAHPGDDKYLSEATVKEMAYNYAIAQYRTAIKSFRDAGLLDGAITYADATVTIDAAGHDNIVVALPLAAKISVVSTLDDAAVAAAGITGITTVSALQAKLDELNTAYASQNVNHTNLGVRHYNGGASYYQIRIKHFGDDLTPWNKNEYSGAANAPQAGNNVDAAYPNNANRDANYLGRYGVLRNNWYEVNISDVVKIGYATVDDLILDGKHEVDPNTPDDHIDKEQWINAEVNILSWAKRIQNNNLGED